MERPNLLPLCLKSLLHYCKFLVNTDFNLETKHIFKTNFISLTWIECFCTMYVLANPTVTPKNAHSFTGNLNPNLTPFFGPTPPPQTAPRSLHTFLHRNATNSPLVSMGCPISTPKTAPYQVAISIPIYAAHPWTHLPNLPNSIKIHSAIFPQLTPTDQHTYRHVK